VITAAPRLRAEAGDRLVLNPDPVRGRAWDGEIVAVLGEHGCPPFAVRWFDSRRITVVVPGPDARVEPLEPITPTEG
jgi:Domain of unknown function (DUF1918)